MPAIQRRTPFVGRERELTLLCERLEEAKHGDGGVVCLAGEPGIGKSRLLAALAERARTEGWLVLSGSAYESDGAAPYLPFSEALRGYLHELPPDAFASVLADATGAVLLVPEFADVVPREPASRLLQRDDGREALFDSVAAALLGAARSATSGLLLILDDLHWADQASLKLLLHVARRVQGAPLLIAASRRVAEVGRGHPLTAALAQLSRERLLTQLQLGPFTADTTAALIEQWTGGPAAPAVVAAVQARSEGNPFFAEELIRLLQLDRPVAADPATAGVALAIPEGVRQVVRQRLVRLSPATNALVELVAAFEDVVAPELLEAAGDLRGDDFAAAIDEAISAGILREEETGYRLSHALVRETVYADVRLLRRRELHLRAARAIEALYGSEPGALAAALAAHYRQAGPTVIERAVACSRRAAAAAMRLLAFEDAIGQLESTLALLASPAGPAQQLQRAGLLERLGDAYGAFGLDPARAVACFEEALSLYTANNRLGEAGRLHFFLGRSYCSFEALLDLPRAWSHLRTAERLLPQEEAPVISAYLYTVMGLAATFDLSTEEGLLASERGLALSDACSRDEIWAAAAGPCIFHLVGAGRSRDAGDLLDGFWARAARREHPLSWFLATQYAGLAAYIRREPMRAIAIYRNGLAHLSHSGDNAPRDLLLQNCADTFLLQGDLEEAQRLVAAIGTPRDSDGASPSAVWLAVHRGDWQLLQALAERKQADARRTGNMLRVWYLADLQGRMYAARGDLPSAERCFREARERGVVGGHRAIELLESAELAITLISSGRTGEASALLERCRELVASAEAWGGIAGRVCLAEAVERLVRSDATSAEPLFARAIAIAQQSELPWDEADALRTWARALGRAGQARAVPGLLEQAAAVYTRVGAGVGWLATLTDVPRSPARSSEGFPDGLTEREVEILGQVAAGRSNKAIAEALVLSERTVERHIANVYEKLDLHGKAARAAAAAYAIRQSLTLPSAD